MGANFSLGQRQHALGFGAVAGLHFAVAAVIVATMQQINPQYPRMSQEQRKELLKAKALLLKERPARGR